MAEIDLDSQSVSLQSVVDLGYEYNSRYSKSLPYTPISLSALDDGGLNKDALIFRHSKVIEMLGHMTEEIHEVRRCVPRRHWRTHEPSFMDSPELRKEFITEMVDVLLFFRATLAWAGVGGQEFTDAYKEKEAQNNTRSDHIKH